MMIHQQPPPKPLLPQHMIQSPHIRFPVTDTGSDAAFDGAGADLRPVSETYYAGGALWVTPLFCKE